MRIDRPIFSVGQLICSLGYTRDLIYLIGVDKRQSIFR